MNERTGVPETTVDGKGQSASVWHSSESRFWYQHALAVDLIAVWRQSVMSNRQRLPEAFLIQNRHFIPYFYSSRQDVNIALPFLLTICSREAEHRVIQAEPFLSQFGPPARLLHWLPKDTSMANVRRHLDTQHRISVSWEAIAPHSHHFFKWARIIKLWAAESQLLFWAVLPTCGTSCAQVCQPAGENCSAGQATAGEHREVSATPPLRALSSFHAVWPPQSTY